MHTLRWQPITSLALSVAGVGMIIYLISAELFIIKAICLWCTSVHVITFLPFVLMMSAMDLPDRRIPRPKS